MITKMRRGKVILISIVVMSFFSSLWSFAADLSTTPAFSPVGGTYSSNQTVTITSTAEGAVIRYTLDGTTPSPTSAPIYSEPIPLTSNTIIRAIAVLGDSTYSPLATAEYIINTAIPVIAPNFSPAGGTYESEQLVTITSTTSGAVIRYTLDGTTPSPTSSLIYSQPLNLTSNKTIRAIAVLGDNAYSPETKADYIINLNTPPAAPIFMPATGTYDSGQTVTMSSTTSGAVIRYTLDGTTPYPTSSPLYSQPIVLTSNTIIKAIAVLGDYTYSSKSTAEYVINTATAVAAPTFSPSAGAYPSGQKISLSSTNNAIIHYTIDNTDPTTSSPVYSEPITLEAAMTVRAIAVIASHGDSDVVSAAYTIQAPASGSGGGGSSTAPIPSAALPAFSPSTGAYASGQKITLTSSTSGARIRYTTDNTDPTADSPVYSEPITLVAAMTIRAIAVKSEYRDSAVASAGYTIKAEEAVRTENAITPQAVNDTPTAQEPPLRVEEAGTAENKDAGTPAAPVESVTPAPAQTAPKSEANPVNTLNALKDSEVVQKVAEVIQDAATDIADSSNTSQSSYIDDLADMVLDKACSAVNATDAQDCKEIFFNKIADNVTCKDPNLSEADCQALLKDKYYSALILLEDKYEKIKESALKIIGENYTSGDLEAYIDKDANVSGTTVPFQSGDVNVKVLRAIGIVVLDEAQEMLQGAPLAVTVDTDADGIPDDIERRIGTDPGNKDTDGDGFDDENEITNGYDPLGAGKKITELSPIEKILINNLELQHPLSGGTVNKDFSVDKIVNADESGDASSATNGYVISGKAEPNSVATIYIYSDIPVVTTVSTDQYGNWRYEFDQPLTDGDHEIYVAINDDTGKVVNKSNPLGFFVRQARAVSSSDMAGIVSSTDTPSSATNNTMALYMIFFAVIVTAAGIMIFLFVVMQKNKTQQ